MPDRLPAGVARRRPRVFTGTPARSTLLAVSLSAALQARQVRVGCCGWPMARERYFQTFPVVELQDTFYQPPSTELARKWRQAAPAEFVFTMKAWQLITHPASSPTYRRLKTPVPRDRAASYGSFQASPEVWQAWLTTLAVARELRAEALVFQCPASFTPTPTNIENLRQFFRRIERGFLVCWEPRGPWDPDLVRRLCEELDLIHCVDPFVAQPVYGHARYLRLHGRGGYRYRYTDEELGQLARQCERWLEAGHEPIYVMFNNVYMKEDAARFLELATGQPVPKEPPSEDLAPAIPRAGKPRRKRS